MIGKTSALSFVFFISAPLLAVGANMLHSSADTHSPASHAAAEANTVAAAVYGFDLTPERQLRMTTEAPSASAAGLAPLQSRTLQWPGRQSVSMLEAADDRPFGEALLGEPLAREAGVMQLAASLYTRSGGKTARISVAEGSAEAALQRRKQLRRTDALSKAWGAAHSGGQTAHGGGLKPFLHALRSGSGDAVLLYEKLDGTHSLTEPHPLALFRGERMVGVLQREEAAMLIILGARTGPVNTLPAAFPVPFPLGGEEVLLVTDSKVTAKSNGDINHPVIHLHAELQVQQEGAVQAERLHAGLAAGADALLARLAELRTDPLQLGQVIRSQYRGIWSEERWKQSMSAAVVKVQFELKQQEGSR